MLQLLERKAAMRGKREPYSYTVRTCFQFRIIKFSPFHGKRQASMLKKRRSQGEIHYPEKVFPEFVLHSPFRTVTFAGHRRAVLGRAGHAWQAVSHLGSSRGMAPRPERQDQLPLGTVPASVGAGARLDLLVQWFA